MHTYPSLGGLSGSAEHHHPACHTTTVSVDYTCTQFVKCVRYSNDIYIYTIVRTQQNAYEADLEGDQLITLNSMLSH